MTREANAIADVTLERYRLNELPDDEASNLSARISADPALQARLSALEASDASIRREYPSKSLEAAVAERVARGVESRPQPRNGTWQLAAIGAAAVFVAAVLLAAPVVRQLVQGGDDRIKGDATALVLYRKAGNGSETLASGATAAAGDQIRIAYRSSGPRFGVIVSLDGAGVVTRHLPPAGSTAAPLVNGALTLLDQAYELDAAPRWECFYLVAGDASFDVGPVLEAARLAAVAAGRGDPPAALALDRHLQQSSFLLRKSSKEARH
jgi:hypothetical protein